MKILAVTGSPRHSSNSGILAEALLGRAAELGAETQRFDLAQIAYTGCLACGACKRTSDICVQRDGLAPVLEELRRADRLVLASPVYFGDFSGQMKLFFDRLYSLANRDYTGRVPPGREAAVLLTQGNTDGEAYADVGRRFGEWLEFLGYGRVQTLIGGGLGGPGEASGRPELLSRARALAEDWLR